MMITSLTESISNTLFQSLGRFPFILQWCFSLSQIFWSLSVTKRPEFSSDRGNVCAAGQNWSPCLGEPVEFQALSRKKPNNGWTLSCNYLRKRRGNNFSFRMEFPPFFCRFSFCHIHDKLNNHKNKSIIVTNHARDLFDLRSQRNRIGFIGHLTSTEA